MKVLLYHHNKELSVQSTAYSSHQAILCLNMAIAVGHERLILVHFHPQRCALFFATLPLVPVVTLLSSDPSELLCSPVTGLCPVGENKHDL